LTIQKKSPALNRVLQRLAFLRMFLLLVGLSVIAIFVLGYLSVQTLESRQYQMAQSMARLVDHYIDQAARSLDAAGYVADIAPSENIDFMQAVWKAFGYFDTLYYLDANSKIRLLIPPNPRYLGLDMSNLPDLKQIGEKKNLTISRPFISLRTGNPTVFLVRQLSQGGLVVGELNLGSLQDEITQRKNRSDQGMAFILDQFGMLLAHPIFTIVKQQTNQSNLKIFRRGIGEDATLVYRYDGRMVLGSAARVKRAGWVVVDQVPLSIALSPYSWALGATLPASLVIWLVLTWNLRRQLKRHISDPLVRLSQGIGALAKGDFGRGKALAVIPGAFAELTALTTDFQQMSDALYARQTALQESEERYRSLFERVPVALFRTTPKGRFLDLNPANLPMLGYSDRETLMKINTKDLYLNPEDRQQWRTIVERDGIVRNFVMQIKRPDGKVVWVRNTAQVIRNSNGEVLYYEGSLEDITECRQAEESVRKLSQAIEQSPVSIVITNAAGSIEFVNAKFTEITGYSPFEALGQNPRILKSGQTPAEVYHRLWQTITSGGIWQGEFRNRKKNGELFWEQATIAPVRDQENVITHYVAVKEDITLQKELEEQLRQSQKMEAVGQLAGGVAHDFNNMLSVIIGHAELALGKVNLNDALRKNLKEILAAGLRSSDITRQLLAFARKQTIMPEILELNGTVEGMLKLLRRLIGEDIDLVWMPAATLWPVKMDPSQIDQILANLCVNARDAIAGVGKISIETQRVVFDKAYCAKHRGFTPGEYVKLAVSDSGSGMDKPTTAKIFEPFFTTKDVGKGTGLGLATVYGIVKQNNGIINVDSERGKGSTFKIYLPRDTTPPPQAPKENAVPQRVCGNETILVVEDEILNLELVEMILKGYGYQVMVASSPGEALLKAKDHTGEIHLLLTDMIMPEMNGRDLSKEICSFYPDLKCLYMSGYTDDMIIHQGILDQAVHFIQKPFTMQNLAAKVREALDTG
jgi:two-component system, cell cycle sensor histidine kinase and response regulator CckA